MSKQLFVAALLIGLLISLGACSKSDTNQSSPANTANAGNEDKNNAAGIENKSEPNKQSGGQVTIIAGADKDVVKVRSTGFR